MSYDLIKRLLQLDSHPESAPFKAAERIEELGFLVEKADNLVDALSKEDMISKQSVWEKIGACEDTDNALIAYCNARSDLNREKGDE